MDKYEKKAREVVAHLYDCPDDDCNDCEDRSACFGPHVAQALIEAVEARDARIEELLEVVKAFVYEKEYVSMVCRHAPNKECGECPPCKARKALEER